MHSQAVQVMEEDDEYDPQRIPTSVFTRSDTSTPAEWSFVSNESLFSLHGGHTSMSTEPDIWLNNEQVRRLTGLSKSGELSPRALRELRKSVGISKSSEFFKSLSPSPTKPKIEDESPTKPKVEEEGEVQVVTNMEEKEVALDEVEKQTPKVMGIEKDEENLPCSSTTSRKSDGSVRSTTSFAFPVLANGANAMGKERNREQHSQQIEETPHSSAPPTVTPSPRSSCFLSWLSCFSCSSCFSYGACFCCCSCFSCTSSTS